MTPYAQITDSDRQQFAEDGFVIKRNFYSSEEIDLLREALRTDKAMHDRAYGLGDHEGQVTEVVVWNEPGDDTFGAFARVRRIVEGAQRLLGGEVYHYHSKFTRKAPGGGGTWDWHQDYGYWYKNGCLFPDMLSVAIAVNPARREHGCLQVLRGSHKLGRIEHGITGGQTGADMERVEQAMKVMEHVYAELNPGDALFFHANTLHTSAPNNSDISRDYLLCCYNRRSNDPFKIHHHPTYTPIDVLPDEAIVEMGLTTLGENRDFMNPERDISIGEYKKVGAA